MSKLRPTVPTADGPTLDQPRTPGEVPQYLTQDVAQEAVDLCRLVELALSRAARGPDLEAVYWRARELLSKLERSGG